MSLFVLVVLWLSCFGQSEPQLQPSNSSQFYDVIVIGAGMAGISAVKQLYVDHNVRNFVILEARDRIGGRVHTIRSDDNTTFYEAGAQYIHGERGNPLFIYIDRNNLRLPKNQQPGGDDLWFNLNGEPISSILAEQAMTLFWRFRNDVEGYSRRSVGHQLKIYIATWLRRNPLEKNGTKLGILDFFYNLASVDEADDLTKVSPLSDNQWKDTRGDQEGNVAGGWSSVIDHLSATFPLDDHIQLSAVVKKISWEVASSNGCRSNKHVEVQLVDGRVFSGKTVLVTLPLGVLKAGSVEFDPKLPQSTQGAIDRLGFGCIGKIFLFFNNKWWGNNGQVLTVFLKSIPDGITLTPGLYNSDEEMMWYRQMTGFNVIYGNPNVLEGWLPNDGAKVMERLPLEEVTKVMNQILDRAFGKTFSVEHPYRIIKSAWCNDPFTLGAYSYTAMGSQRYDRINLAQSLPSGWRRRRKSRLFFAGEATNGDQWSTVHGAYTTGIRAAARIARQIRRCQ